MGHGFVPAHAARAEAAEAIRRTVDCAFSLPGIRAAEAGNPEAWAEQLAPVTALGFERYRDWRNLKKPG